MSDQDRTIPERPVGEFWFGYNEYVPLPEADDDDDEWGIELEEPQPVPRGWLQKLSKFRSGPEIPCVWDDEDDDEQQLGKRTW